MISLRTKQGNINLAANNSSVNIEVQGESNINLTANDNAINLQTENESIELKENYIKGDPGAPGADGFSPVVEVKEVDGGHEVSITDAEGTDTFIVKDGKDGDSANAAPANWKENDPNAPGYIHNRTHYYTDPYTVSWDGETPVETVIAEEDEFTSSKFRKIYGLADKYMAMDLKPEDVIIDYKIFDQHFVGSMADLKIVNNGFTRVEGEGYIRLDTYMVFVYDIDASVQFNANETPVHFPTSGIWVYDFTDEDLEQRVFIREITLPPGVKPLDVRFIPDEVYENMPKPVALESGENAIIEDNHINVFTNTGYKISDKDVKYQSITSTDSGGKHKIIFVADVSKTFIVDGGKKLRVSKNNIDFEIVEFTRELNDIIYVPYNSALVILSSADGVLLVSSDYGETWVEHYNSDWVGYDYLFTYKTNGANFNMVRKSEREIRCYRLQDDFSIADNGYFRTDFHQFMARFNNTYFISCNSAGQFGYCNEKYYYDSFADLPSGYTVNTVVSHENTPIVGLKNSSKIFQLKYTGNTSSSKWVEYTLPQVCSVNDVIYYPNTKDFYILTDINSYYKTKDFITYESIDTGARGLQGCITLMGLQAITSNNGKLMLAPSRTRLEDKAQEWDKTAQKERWVGEGLRLNSTTGVVSVRVNPPLQIVSSTGAIRLQALPMEYMPVELQKSMMLIEAPIHSSVIADYGDMDTWFWEVGYPLEGYNCAHKIIFDEATTFYDFANYETEYSVEQYEYGYIYYDETNGYFCEYVKLGNFANLLNKE